MGRSSSRQPARFGRRPSLFCKSFPGELDFVLGLANLPVQSAQPVLKRRNGAPPGPGRRRRRFLSLRRGTAEGYVAISSVAGQVLICNGLPCLSFLLQLPAPLRLLARDLAQGLCATLHRD